MSKDKEGEYNLKKKKKKILDKFAYDMWDDSWENVKKSAPSIPTKVYLQMIEDMLDMLDEYRNGTEKIKNHKKKIRKHV